MTHQVRILFDTLRRTLIFSVISGIFVLLSFLNVKSEEKYLIRGTHARQPEEAIALFKVGDSVKTVLKTPPSSKVSYQVHDISKNLKSSMRVSMDTSMLMTQHEIDKGLESLSQAVKELDKLAVEPDSSVREAGVKHVLSLFQINMNGAGLDQLSFSDKYKSFLTPENLRKSSANFSGIKREIEKLNKQKSGQDNMNCLLAMGKAVIQDELIENAMTELMENVIPQMDIFKLFNNTNSKSLNDVLTNANPLISSIVKGKSDDKNAQKGRDKKLLDEALHLRPEQIRFCDVPFRSQTQLVSIERGRKETKVTLAIPMHDDSDWFLLDKGFTITDKKTNDRYHMRGLERDLPLDKIIVVEGFGGKMVEATLIFPRLRKSVAVVDLIEYPSAGVNAPSDNKPWSFRNIYIDDYSTGKSKAGKEYK